MGLSDERFGEETSAVRMMVWTLVEKQGLTEQEALVKALPGDANRGRKLRAWKQKGLWPPPEARGEQEEGPVRREEEKDRGSQSSERALPPEWKEELLMMVRPLVNAAILDYHNYQIVRMDDKIASVQDAVAELTAHAATPAVSREEVSELVNTAVQAFLSDASFVQAVQTVHDDIAAPPRPRTFKGSRKLVVQRKKLQGTCDKALFDLFERDRKTRGFNISQMLDFVLYNYYGHPTLSFEERPDPAADVPELEEIEKMDAS